MLLQEAPPPVAARAPAWYRATRAARVAAGLTPLIAVHLALLAMFQVEVTLLSVIYFFVTTRIAGLGITIGYHRQLTHHSFKTSRWFQFLMAFAGCTALQKGPIWWVVHHRLHHKHSDTEHDPHSPVVDGFWYGHMGWIFARDLASPECDSVRDLTRFPELVWLDRLWVVPGLLAALASYLVAGWPGLIYGYCLGTVGTFHVTFAINSLGHTWGRQRFATGEGSRNNALLGILAMGEGWHNNHHRAPTSARHGFAWYEFDMAYTVIKLLKRFGLVWGLRLPPAEAMAAAREGKAELRKPR